MFQASPDNASSQQKRDFQSEVLLATMEIFRTLDMGSTPLLRGEGGGELGTSRVAAGQHVVATAGERTRLYEGP